MPPLSLSAHFFWDLMFLPLPIPLHLSLVERFVGHLGLSGESIALPGAEGGMASCNGCSPVLATQVMDE